MLSNNTSLICRKVRRLRYSISTVCFEIPKGSILHSQWGKSKHCKWYISLLEKHKYPSYTHWGGSRTSDAFSKSHHFPTGCRCSPFPRIRFQMSILSWSTEWVFSDRGMQSCCGGFCFQTKESFGKSEPPELVVGSLEIPRSTTVLPSWRGITEKHLSDSRLLQGVDKYQPVISTPSHPPSHPGAGLALLLLNHLPTCCNFQPYAQRWTEIHLIATCHCMFFGKLRCQVQPVNFYLFLFSFFKERNSKKW